MIPSNAPDRLFVKLEVDKLHYHLGKQDIVISGQALNAGSLQPEAIVPLQLVIAANGFERKFSVTTDTNGNYAYTFKPLPGESGLYKVSAVHPDIVDRPEQGQFSISRVSVSPTQATLNIPRNLDHPGNFRVSSGDGTSATNLRLEFLAAEQPGGVLPQGITVSLPAGVNLAPNSSASLNLSVLGDDTAAETGSFVLSLRSDESGAESASEPSPR